MKNLFRSLFISIVTISVLMTGGSCEIGLGSSVDTEAPKLAIDYPQSGAHVRNKFLLSGTWNDDKAVSGIDIEVCKKVLVTASDGTQTTQITSVYSSEASVNDNGRWSINLNEYDEEKYTDYNGWQFGDGEYILYATARDAAGHSSDRSERGIYIDNSAPVLLLTKPATSGSDNDKETYGQIVQLTGNFYDYSGNLSSLKVDFYDKNGTKLHESTYSNITSMDNSNPLTIARYFSESSGGRTEYADLYNAYKALVGESVLESFENGADVEDIQVYFSVTAYDEAKTYDNLKNTDGSGEGNATTVYYRGTASMSNLTTGDGAIQNFTLSDFAAYKNRTTTKWDTYKDSIDSVSNAARSWSTSDDTITNVTNDDSTGDQNVYLTFVINPNNNPTFSVGGYEVVSTQTAAADTDTYSTGGYKKVYSGAPVPVTVSVGLDNKNISTSSVSIYRVDRTVYTGTITSDMFTGTAGLANYNAGVFELAWTWNADVKNEFADWGMDVSSIYQQTSTEANVSSLTKQLSVSSFTSGHDYLFYVVAQDIAGNQAVSVNRYGYGFCGTTSVSAPIITVTSGNRLNDVVNEAVFKGTGAASLSDVLYVAGTISSQQELNTLTATLTVTDSADSSSTLSKNYDITINTGAAPDYSSDYTSNYCYQTTPDGTTPISYSWRFTSASAGNDFASVIASGSYDVSLIITANNGASSTFQRTFTLDTQDPVPELSEISPAAETTGGYWINPAKELTLTGLVTDNLSTAKACTTAVKLVALNDDGSAEVSSTKWTSAGQNGVNKWSFTVPANAAASGYGANLYISSTDSAGNTGTASVIKLRYDTTAPAGKHAMDKKHKDLYFRVGSNNNDDISKTANPALWDDDLDTDVGGKYQENTYGNTTTIKIRGNFQDDESGLSMIYYKVISSDTQMEYSVLKNKADLFFANYNNSTENGYTGYFAPLDSGREETRRVFFTSDDGKIQKKYVDSNGNIQAPDGEYEIVSTKYITNASGEKKYYTNIVSNFDSVLSGFKEGINYLLLVAEDKVGNATFDCVIAVDGGDADGDGNTTEDIIYYNASINVDTDSPSMSCTSHSGTQYTNGVTPITVEGTSEDSGSGVKKIVLKVNNEEVTISEDDIADDGRWTTEIPISVLSTLTSGKTYNVNGTVTDGAGNESASTLFTLSSDTTPPVVKISSPVADSDVNGTVSLNGTVTIEGAIPSKLELYYSTSVPSGDIASYTRIDTITDSSKIYSWSFDSIDTYDLSGVESSPETASLYFIPVVTDTAGNNTVYDLSTSAYKYVKGTNYFEYTVDMNTDRPTVKVTNLTQSDGVYILKYGEDAKIEGTLSDDDATSEIVAKNFVATTSQITSLTGVNSTESGDVVTSKVQVGTKYDITTFNKKSGEWTFTPAETGDGEKTVYFYIKDNEDKVFYTGKIETVNGNQYKYSQPYFQYKTSTAVDSSSALAYKSDGTSPTIVNTLVQAYDSGKTAYGIDSSNPEGKQEAPGTSLVLGGTKKQYAKFLITAYDANGIDGIRLTLNYKDKTGADKSILIASKDGYEGFTENGSITGTTTAVWTTDYIDVSSMKTGSISGTLEVYDNSGLLGTASPIFMVDNSGPAVTLTSPSSTDELTGSITFGGTSTDDGSAGTYDTAWLIPTLAQAALSDTEIAALKNGSGNSLWNNSIETGSSVGVWKFILDSATLTGYDSTTYTNDTAGDIYTLPFYVKTEDELGNCTIYRDFTFRHNPEGDRPLTKISYPNESNYTAPHEYVTLGGAVRITGSAEIPSATTTVGNVYLQIISGTANIADSGTYTQTSAYIASLKHEGNFCYTVANASSAASELGIASLTFASDVDPSSWWGIKANNTASWNFTINSNGEMNPDEGEITYIAIRACAVNAEGKVGSWTDWTYINIDNTAPTQQATLKQYTTAPSTACVAADIEDASNIVAGQAYSNGVYLKDDWYLTVMLHDESELKVPVVTKGNSSLTEGTDYYLSTLVTGSDGKEKTRYVFIPVDKTNATVSYTVTVEDTEHAISATYTLNIDNAAPVIESIYKGASYNAANVLKTGTGETNKIADSDYVYTLGGTVEETASGFERLVFYYVRSSDIDGKTYDNQAVLDPLVTTGTADSKALLSGLTKRTFTQESSNYYMYAKAVAGTLEEYKFTPSTASDITGNAHIREGGLIEAGGILRRIESIDANGVVTFRESTGLSASVSRTVYFPYAQVVDNTATESTSSTSANPFTFKNSSDDGDSMPETLTGSKSIGYTWDATIHSYNMPDGPCSLVVLAFDKAGNVSGGIYPVNVENSAPRLAKVWFGTDLNSNGEYETSEFEGYNLYSANQTYGIDTTEVKDALEISTANFGDAFTIKNKLAVIAELVGGNGEIIMVYGKDASSLNAVTVSNGTTAVKDDSLTAHAAASKLGTVTYNKADTATALSGYTIANTAIVTAVTEANDGTGKGASFTFWDETDELTQGTDSQNCVLYVNDFTIDLVDSIPPKVVVNPFYWAGIKKNSIYGSSTASSVSDLKGHIELEKDLTGTAALTLYGSDPKVSGKIVFTGTAYDDHALSSLTFSFANLSGTIATYDKDNLTWTPGTGTIGTSSDSGWKATVTYTDADTAVNNYHEDNTYFSQSGHKVYWTLAVDTELITNKAQENVSLTVTATDLAGRTNVSTVTAPDTTSGYVVTDGTTNVPSYQMDVVPYITGIKTSVRKASGLKDNNIRSASGKYSILANNEDNVITVTGFNFNTSDLVAKIAKESVAHGTAITKTTGGTALTITATDTNTATITNSGISASGYLEIFSKGVRALNNINKDDAYGTAKNSEGEQLTADNADPASDYSSAYNREPDYYTTKNIQLKDDRYLRFFDMKDTGIKNGYYPVMIMNGNNPVFGYIDKNGVNDTYDSKLGTNGTSAYPENYVPQRAEFSATTGKTSSITYLIGGMEWDQMAMAKDDSGKFIHATMFNDSASYLHVVYNNYAENHKWNRNTYTDGWGNQTSWYGYSGDFASNNNNNAIVLEPNSYGDSTLIGRYQGIKLAAKGNSDSEEGARYYMAYYDDNTTNKNIIFRTFKVGTTTFGVNTLSNNHYSNLADNDTDGRVIVASDASKHLDLVVNSNNQAVIAYYDADNSQMYVKYSEGGVDGTDTTPDITWKTVSGFKDSAGQYLSMTVDGFDCLHIAAFDATESDLIYYYVPYDSTEMTYGTPVGYYIDQYASVGNWTDIQVKGDTTNGYIPYISYYNATETGNRQPLKLAYFNGTAITLTNYSTALKEGVDESGYTTGNWEYMTVPAITPPQGGDPKFQNVCLGFDSDGVPVIGYLGTYLEFGKEYPEE